MPTYGEYTETLGDVLIGPQATPSGLSTHHVVYPVYSPGRQETTNIYIYIYAPYTYDPSDPMLFGLIIHRVDPL